MFMKIYFFQKSVSPSVFVSATKYFLRFNLVKYSFSICAKSQSVRGQDPNNVKLNS